MYSFPIRPLQGFSFLYYQDLQRLVLYHAACQCWPHSLSSTWRERPDYENVKNEHREYMKVEPINFNQEHKEMLGHCKMLLERGYIAINPSFDKLIISLRTAVAEENI